MKTHQINLDQRSLKVKHWPQKLENAGFICTDGKIFSHFFVILGLSLFNWLIISLFRWEFRQ